MADDFDPGASPRARGNRGRAVSVPPMPGCIPASAGESTDAIRDVRVARVHPRERGGIVSVVPTRKTSVGASPRARGNPTTTLFFDGLNGCIPASAGESRGPCTCRGRRRVHPRERGGIYARSGLRLREGGASPRARGNLNVAVAWVRRTGCIPASAGESAPRRARRPDPWVHPRERGGITLGGLAAAQRTGASPRARGNRRAPQ